MSSPSPDPRLRAWELVEQDLVGIEMLLDRGLHGPPARRCATCSTAPALSSPRRSSRAEPSPRWPRSGPGWRRSAPTSGTCRAARCSAAAASRRCSPAPSWLSTRPSAAVTRWPRRTSPSRTRPRPSRCARVSRGATSRSGATSTTTCTRWPTCTARRACAAGSSAPAPTWPTPTGCAWSAATTVSPARGSSTATARWSPSATPANATLTCCARPGTAPPTGPGGHRRMGGAAPRSSPGRQAHPQHDCRRDAPRGGRPSKCCAHPGREDFLGGPVAHPTPTHPGPQAAGRPTSRTRPNAARQAACTRPIGGTSLGRLDAQPHATVRWQEPRHV